MDGTSCLNLPAGGADRVWREWSGASLVWMPERGCGYYPVAAMPYDAEYFRKYRGYAETPMGHAITDARAELVARHYAGPLLDVGIGCGDFCQHRRNTYGFDVNPAGVQWLQERGLYLDLYAGSVPAASFWDSLEHIPDPGRALEHVARWAFISIPIFEGVDHVLASRHYRRDEHCWYFTADGLVRWMREHGFELREVNQMESVLGRDGISSFAFERVS